MLEFAIVLPLFLLLLFAMIDFSRLLFTYTSMTNGARELARAATITSNSMNTVVSAFNNLTIVGGTVSPATNVTLAPASGAGSGSISCTSSNDAMCTIQVSTGSSTNTTGCTTTGVVCLRNVVGATGSATYTGSPLTYSFNPSGTGDFVMLTWLSPDQYGLQQGYIEVCRLPLTTNCVFPTGLNRSQNTDGIVQVDVRYTFQFNPLFQTRLDGIVDVSFMRPSTLLTTTVRTYAE